MKKILFIILMALPFMANAQTQPPNQTFSGLLYEFKYALRADSIMLLPRNDTIGIRPSLLAPGAIIYRIADKTFYGYDGSYWKSFASGTLRALDSLRYDPSTSIFYGRYTTGGEFAVPTGLVDSLKARWDTLQFPTKVQYTIMDKLLAGPATPPQPGDSLVVVLEKLIALYNSLTGKFIDNQNSVDQSANFRISGTGRITATDNQLSIVRSGTGTNHFGLIYFRDDIGNTYAHFGLGETVARNYLYFTAAKSGIFQTVADTSSLIFRAYNPVNGAIAYTSWRNGRMLFSDTVLSTQYQYVDTATYPIEVRNVSGISARFWQGIQADQLLAGTGSSTYKADIRGAGLYRFNGNALNLRPESSATGNIFIQFNNTSDAAIGYIGFTSGANNNLGFANLVSGAPIAFITNNGTNTLERMRISANGNLLIGTTGDNGEALRVAGGISISTATITGNTTLTAAQTELRVNNSGTATLTLPAAASVPGHIYVIKKVSAASNDVVIDPNASETIDGATTKTITLQYSSVIITSNGTSWDVIGSHANATIL